MVGIRDLDPEQRARLAAYWWRRAEGEMTSWVGFGHVLEDLRAEGADAALLKLAERSVSDEYQHALWCRDWARRFGHPGCDDPKPRSEERISFRGAMPDENRVLRIALCCFTESVGCFILRQVRPVISESELRKLNRRHMADELRHSRVGWGYLGALDAARRDLLRLWLPALFEILPLACCEGPEEPYEELVPFGYFTPRLLRAAHDEAMREVIMPGLEHLGLARAA
ncbi:MAG TPA: hypothetical protein VM686_14980 [Polyangiaceae bacterium]|nr:hypothetical protein [Polyangiaceae bacterium]